MPDNTHRFTGRAADYDRYRQRYPAEEVLAHLRDWCGFSAQWLVADIGAGTGMLAEVFLANGNRVLAVEPNPDMRAEMRPSVERHLATAAPQLEVIDATAEQTTLASGSVDLIAVGRAFHWFDKESAAVEFRRILKPEGWVVLVAADRDRESKDPAYREQIDAQEKLMASHGDYRSVSPGFRAYERVDAFFDGEIHQAHLPGLRSMDWDTYSGHARSLSVSPQPGQSGYARFEKDLREYFDSFALDGILTMPTRCWITAGRFLPR